MTITNNVNIINENTKNMNMVMMMMMTTTEIKKRKQVSDDGTKYIPCM